MTTGAPNSAGASGRTAALPASGTLTTRPVLISTGRAAPSWVLRTAETSLSSPARRRRRMESRASVTP